MRACSRSRRRWRARCGSPSEGGRRGKLRAQFLPRLSDPLHRETDHGASGNDAGGLRIRPGACAACAQCGRPADQQRHQRFCHPLRATRVHQSHSCVPQPPKEALSLGDGNIDQAWKAIWFVAGRPRWRGGITRTALRKLGETATGRRGRSGLRPGEVPGKRRGALQQAVQSFAVCRQDEEASQNNGGHGVYGFLMD
jgi:hypothetical protein